MNEAELLFSEIMNCDRAALYRNNRITFDKDKSLAVSSVLKRRIRGEPIQYILGKTEFMGLEFKVTPDALIPRPETEIVVETAIKQLSVVGCQLSEINILDLGTGSGCIGISLAKFLSHAKITATDISGRAIEIARQNALLNNVQIKFLISDLFSNYGLRTTDYGLIISNPPYIPNQQIKKLQPEIQYEPRIALEGGQDGLDFYRRIIKDAPLHLKESGLLVMEMGYNQRSRLENIFQKSGNFEIIEVVKDYNNIDRVIVALKLKKNG